jgi:hypothetical protein
MASDDYDVHGPHDEELEHAAEHGRTDRLAGRIAVTTAILATLGSFFAYMSGATEANAVLYKSDAAIRKTSASDQWNYYQAKNTKQDLSELGLAFATDDKKAAFQQAADRAAKDKAMLKDKADALEAEAAAFDAQSEEEMHRHHRWAQATVATQIAIALAAITLLTRRRWLLWGVYGLSVLGVALGTLAAFGI